MQKGGCQCGEVRYESVGTPLALYVCHCRECQKQSASAFGLTLDVPRAGLRLIQGNPQYWNRSTDSGGTLRCAFCPTCGSRVWHESEPVSDTISIKAGSLDEPIDVSKAIHVWVTRKLPGILIPEGRGTISTRLNDDYYEGRNTMNTTTIFDLPFDEVVELYQQRLEIEAINDIAARTRLRSVYPELYYPDSFSEITQTMEMIQQVTVRAAERAKITFLDFKAKKVLYDRTSTE